MAYQRGSLQRHEQLKHQILSNPEIVGIAKKDIISVETEYPLTKRRRTVFARPDIHITYRCKQGICRKFIEIKSGNGSYARADLTLQLKKIDRHIKRYNLDAAVIGVYPDAERLAVMRPNEIFIKHCP
ncbi:hypothetical protein HY489_05900 [Candidatus Woesearchaeota archaeon]|nr:hypothetical protein [Candidatus Woesearchaeota archaeon]